MAGSSSEEAVEVESDDNLRYIDAKEPRHFVFVGISIIYILVIRMGEGAAERYRVFPQKPILRKHN